MSKPKTMTLGELKAQLAFMRDMPDDTEIYFGAGDLSFYRPKSRRDRTAATPGLIQIEFNQLYTVTLDPDLNE